MATRRDLLDPTDPARMSPEQRLSEVAAIVAAGVVREPEWRLCAGPQTISDRFVTLLL